MGFLTNQQTCLNRTFMELKRLRLYARGGAGARLNRTFMELKLYSHDTKFGRELVLIEPLWN